MLFVRKIRRAAPVLFAALALSVGACDPETPTRNDHPDVASVRLTVGSQTVTVTESGQTGTLTVPQGQSTVGITWLDSGGSTITFTQVVTLQIVSVTAGTGVSFAASGLGGGLLTTTSAGQKSVTVRLIHGDHPDFEATMNFTVT